MKTTRFINAAILPAATIAAPVLAIARFRDELPDPVATHWNLDGTVDGSMSLTGLLLTAGATLVLPGIALLVGTTVWSHRLPRGSAPFGAGLGAFLAVLGSAIVVSTAVEQRGLATYTDADSPAILLVIAAATVAGLGAALLNRSLPYAPSSLTSHRSGPAFSSAESMELGDAERMVFVETQSVNWLLAVAMAIFLAGVVTVVFGPILVGVILMLSALPAAALGRIRVQVDRNGVVVRSALIPLRFAKIGLADIESAGAIDVNPMSWGGWGYRGSLRVAGTAAVVTRGGPGMRLDLTKDRLFAVTLDDPDTPSRLLNTLVTA